MSFTELQLSELRDAVRQREKPSRFQHTLGVEREAMAIGNLYIPSSVSELRAAALLHDLTKGLTDEEQIALSREFDLLPTDGEQIAPQVLHGHTAAALIPTLFPDFATPQILQAVRLHTTGAAGMTVFDEIIFLADYIEEGRVYGECKRMRDAFWQTNNQILHDTRHLDEIVREVLLNTLRYLQAHAAPIDNETRSAYIWLCEKTNTTPDHDVSVLK